MNGEEWAKAEEKYYIDEQEMKTLNIIKQHVHKVYNLEKEEILMIKDDDETFETWSCFHRRCNYYELRLASGHSEDK